MFLLEIDELGLTQMDRSLLKIIIENFKGGPVGLETLAVGLSEEKETIEDVYEPFLIQAGLLARTPRGRVVTDEAYQHLRINIPKKQSNENLKLF
jgi:holliday junction DNA helicase RuvB